MSDYGFGDIGDYSGYDNTPIDFSSDLGIDWTNYDGSGSDYSFPTSEYVDLSNSGGSTADPSFWDTLSQGVSGFMDGTGGPLSSLLNNGLALAGGAYDLYQGNQTNELTQKSLDLQNKLSQAAIKTNANNDYRTFTGQAGGFTGDAYNTAMNNAKMKLMMSLMGQDQNLPAADRTAMTGLLDGIQSTYEPVYQGYANDDINRRNAQYAAPYNSNAPFPTQMGIPEGTDPAMINKYLASLGVA